MPQLAEDRQAHIAEAIDAQGRATITDLAARFEVSEMTIRRDLRRLADRGLVRRVHGGAVALRSVRFDDRLEAQAPQKAKAARKLARFLPESGLIYLDGSTTMLHLVPELSAAASLQVATNNVETFRRLSAQPGVEPILIGGALDRRTDNLVGPLAVRSLLALSFAAAFFSAWGLTDAAGPVEATLEDAEVKELVAGRAAAVYLAVHAEKLGTRAAGAWSPPPETTRLATDLNPRDRRLQAFRGQFTTIY
jgi:DeoR/GlpR family transcriptional regulator of sugar metabolism